MVDIAILLINGTQLNYTTKEIKVSENFMRFATVDNVGVGIPIRNILFWEVHEKE